MTTYRPTMPEAQAIGLCFLARQPGLPPIDLLRRAVAQLHPLACGWCDYPPAELLTMLEPFRAPPPHRTYGGPESMTREEVVWWSTPNQMKREAIRLAQHGPQE